MGGINRRFLGFLWVFLFFLSGAGAADVRTVPVNVNVILDGSRDMGPFMDQAAAWLCDYLVEGVLSEGDRLNVWIAGERARTVYSGVLGGGEWKEALKKTFRSVVPASGQADFAGALREAARSPDGKAWGIPAYTILVSSSGSLPGGEEAAYLRYSRNREFSGWRVVTVALNAGPGVQAAVQAYLGG
jgi:hypothetical protein